LFLTTCFHFRNYPLVRLAYQPPSNSTFLSDQTSTSHQPPAKRTGCVPACQLGMSLEVMFFEPANNHGALLVFVSAFIGIGISLR
jgi:hypothetical protein